MWSVLGAVSDDRVPQVLDERAAQAVVDRVRERLGHDVDLTDVAGVIVASGDRTRIGTVHEGARRALAHGGPEVVPVEAADRTAGTLPGVNAPIRVAGEIVGVVGVTGKPARAEAATASVALAVELMLDQQASQDEWERRRRARGQLVLDLVAGRVGEADGKSRLAMLGCAMTEPFLLLTLVLDRAAVGGSVRQLDAGQPGLLLSLDAHETAWVIAGGGHHETARVRVAEARRTLARHGVPNRLVDAGTVTSLVELARLARRAARARGVVQAALPASRPGPRSASPGGREPASAAGHDVTDDPGDDTTLADLELPVLLAGLDPLDRWETMRRLLGGLSRDQRRTVAALLAADLVVTRAARALVVHRNTLLQRLDAITRVTGRDPRRLADAAAFHVALLMADDGPVGNLPTSGGRSRPAGAERC